AAGLLTMLTCGGRVQDASDDGDGTDGNGDATLTSLVIKPNNDVLLVDLNKEETKPFTVRGTFADGSSADYTRKVKWSVDNPVVGKFQQATFHSSVLDKNKVDFTKIYAKLTTEDGRQLAAVAGLTIVWLRTSGNSQDFFFNLPYDVA